MQNINITLVQTKQFWEDKIKNLEHFAWLLEKQLSHQTDIIVFPEMFHTGFTMNAALLAEKMEDSLGIDWLRKTAKFKNALCIASLIIEENGQFYNRMVAVHPNGKIEHYDKVHLFTLAKEDEHFSSGNKRTIVEFRGWKILLQVCYDLRFPENARNSVSSFGNFEFDAIIYVANWPERRITHWDKLLPARAIENQCFVIAVNRVGADANNLEYNGSSQIIDALGNYVLNPIQCEESVQSIDLKHDNLEDTRSKLKFLKDRNQRINF